MTFIPEIDKTPPDQNSPRFMQWVLNNFLLLSSILENFGSIYVADGSTAQTGLDTTPVKLTGFTTNGVSKGIIPNHTNDTLTVIVTGVYDVYFTFSFAGSTSVEFEFHVCIAGVESHLGTHRNMGTGGDVGSISARGFLELNADDVLDIRVNTTSGSSKQITLRDAHFGARRIG